MIAGSWNRGECMTEQHTADLGSLIDALTSHGALSDAHALTKVAKAVAKLFEVDADEVALLRLNTHIKMLKFVIPEKLAAVGTIPLSSTSALAARTARERRPELANNFSSARHATVFEGAPIMDGGQVLGVVQISRKGRTSPEAGPDFTQKDLRVLTSVSPTLARFLKLCPDS
jgi:hypothetical protein